MGEFLAYGMQPLQANSKIKIAAWPTTWRLPIFIQVTLVNSSNGFAIDNCTMNIALIYYLLLFLGSNFVAGFQRQSC